MSSPGLRFGQSDDLRRIARPGDLIPVPLTPEPGTLYVPEKLRPVLFGDSRFGCAYGGRVGMKSHTVAGYIAVAGSLEPMRVFCGRHIQKSIRESVHQLIADKIAFLGLSNFYRVLDTEIRGANGTQIFYGGLQSHTAEHLKSLEGVDLAWLEEANTIPDSALKKFIPTIRKPGSRILFTWNPELETDPVHKRFVVDGDPEACVVKIGIEDNPFASREAWIERNRAYHDNPADAAWVWGGECRPSVVGAIYEQQLAAMKLEGRVVRLPYDRAADMVVALDLGFGDQTSLVYGQHVRRERRILRYYENNGEDIPHYIDNMKASGFRIDRIVLPHDARSRSILSKKSVFNRMKDAFPNADVVVVGRDEDDNPIGLEDQIDIVRAAFGEVWIDPDGAGELLERLKRYRRRHDRTTNTYREPLHDTNSNGADAFRYWNLLDPPRKRIPGSNFAMSVPSII